MRTSGARLAAITLACAALACSGDKKQNDKTKPGKRSKPAAKPLHTAEQSETLAKAAVGKRVAVAQILISWKGLKYVGRKPKPTRTKKQAQALAAKVIAAARKDPSKFVDLVHQYSEGPFEGDGGHAPSWPENASHDVNKAVLNMKIGDISDAVEFPHGILILKRETPLERIAISARRLTVTWKGLPRAGSVSRTKAEALARATELHKRAVANPAGFEALIKKESDGHTKTRGGFLGTWRTEAGPTPVLDERLIHALPVDGISKVHEGRWGYVVYQRLKPGKLVTLLSGAHILITYEGAAKASGRITRSKADALELARKLADEVRHDPIQFGLTAKAKSDDATKRRGGHLGSWKPGTKMPRIIDDTISHLGFKESSDPVETKYGYHVLMRYPSPTDNHRKYFLPYEKGRKRPSDDKPSAHDKHDDAKGHEGHNH